MTAPEPSPPATALDGAAEQQVTPSRSRYAMGSLANMVRSLLVILVLLAGLIAIVPRVSQVTQPPVDAASVVAYAVKDSGTPFAFPREVPAGWVATSARYAAFADSVPTWQAGWTTPEGRFVGLKEAVGVTPAWLTAATTQGRPEGTVEAGGRTWEVRMDERGQTHLVGTRQVPGGTLTTVVSGTAGAGDLRPFAAALAPAHPAP